MTTPEEPRAEDAGPDTDGKFSLNEDWLATGIGLVLLVLVLTGVIGEGIVP